MFGLLQSSAPENNDYSVYRLHYCGVCKVMGRDYGTVARLALNSDVVFLARLLSEVNGENPETWARQLHSYNCLNLPGKHTNMPPLLQYCAAVNVVLAGFKIADNRSDEGGMKWAIAGRIFKRPAHIAAGQLSRYGLPVERIQRLMQEFQYRERNTLKGDLEAVLNWCARPVALVTALCMAYGAAPGENRSRLFRFGYAFGKLVYLLDANRDQEEDSRKRQFNPFFHVLSPVTGSQVYDLAARLRQQLLDIVEEMPLSDDSQLYFKSTIFLNIEKSFSAAGWIQRAEAACNHQAQKYGFKKRLQVAGGAVGDLVKRSRAAFAHRPMARIAYRVLLLTVGFMAIFIHPAAAAAVKEQAARGNFSIAEILWAGPAAAMACKCCCCEKKDGDNKGSCSKNSGSSGDSKCCQKNK